MGYATGFVHIAKGIDRMETEWLYGSWSESKYNEYLQKRAFLPLYASYADMKFAQRETEQYLNRYHMTYEDVKNPNKLPSAAPTEAFYRNSVNYVSKNIERLYR